MRGRARRYAVAWARGVPALQTHARPHGTGPLSGTVHDRPRAHCAYHDRLFVPPSSGPLDSVKDASSSDCLLCTDTGVGMGGNRDNGCGLWSDGCL